MIDHLPATRALEGAPAIPGPGDVIAAWLGGRKPTTLDAYRRDLATFAAFLKCATDAQAVELFLSQGPGPANRIALSYRSHMVERKLASATVARRLAALRSLVKVARMIGRITWALDVESPKVQSYRDTRGPGLTAWQRIYEAVKQAASEGSWSARRDLAIVLLLRDLGLRRGEVAGLDLADIDRDSEPPAVMVVGKGKTSKDRLTLNTRTLAAIADWISVRGDGPGPLFVRLDRAAELPERLTGRAIHYLVKTWGGRAGLKGHQIRPHGLRHHAITLALNVTGGNVREVKGFSRHASVQTVLKYDDARHDHGGKITRILGEDGD